MKRNQNIYDLITVDGWMEMTVQVSVLPCFQWKWTRFFNEVNCNLASTHQTNFCFFMSITIDLYFPRAKQIQKFSENMTVQWLLDHLLVFVKSIWKKSRTELKFFFFKRCKYQPTDLENFASWSLQNFILKIQWKFQGNPMKTARANGVVGSKGMVSGKTVLKKFWF